MNVVSSNPTGEQIDIYVGAKTSLPGDIPTEVANYFESLNSTLNVQMELWCANKKANVTPSENSSKRPWSEHLENASRETDSVIELNSETSLLCVPIDSFIACQSFPTNSIHLYFQLAQLIRDKHRQSFQIGELQAEITALNGNVQSLTDDNEQFLLQITADMEELTFLRQLCGFLELKSQNSDVMSDLFLTVANQVKSEWIGFIPNPAADTPNYRSAVCLKNPQSDAAGPEITVNHLEKVMESWSHEVQVIIENDFPQNDNFSKELEGIESLLICSVEKADQFFGWIVAVNRLQNIENDLSFAPTTQKSEFGSVEAGLLSSASATFATHCSNLDLLAANKQLLTDVVRCLVTAIESKDSYTCGHSERVARYGQRIAREIGLSDKEIERIYLSGLLHDVGKIGIPDSILLKTTAPTDEEFDEIKKHPEDGWKILQSVKQLDAILDGVLFHHERVDGKGYPDGLVNDEIPLHGKILAVADSFDAMTSDRPYRKGMPTSKAYQIIEGGANTQWDGEIVEAFLAITKEIESIKEQYRREPSPQRIEKTTHRLEE